jgi:hypothetical protein
LPVPVPVLVSTGVLLFNTWSGTGTWLFIACWYRCDLLLVPVPVPVCWCWYDLLLVPVPVLVCNGYTSCTGTGTVLFVACLRVPV